MKFVAVLEPNDKCNLGCHGTGEIRHLIKKGTKSATKQSICPCCEVTLLSQDPNETLEQLAEITGRSVAEFRGGILTPAEFLESVRKRKAQK